MRHTDNIERMVETVLKRYTPALRKLLIDLNEVAI